MSSQFPHLLKRNAVRKAFAFEEYQKASDREVAKRLGFSRPLVASVRREMIAAGEHPPYEVPKFARPGAYKPGQSARGGYVYDENGKTIRLAEWDRRQRNRLLPNCNEGAIPSQPILVEAPLQLYSVVPQELNFVELGQYLSISREAARRLCVVDNAIPYKRYGIRICRVSLVDAEKYRCSCTHPPASTD